MDSKQFVRQQIFDPVQRLLHWWTATVVLALTILGWAGAFIEVGSLKASINQMHIVLGFALAAGLILRGLWAVIGPKQASVFALVHAAKRFITLKGASHRSIHVFGYESRAAVVYLIFYGLMIGAVISGLILSAMRYDKGPFAGNLFDELSSHEIVLAVHASVLYGTTLFILAHVFGMIWHEKVTGTPIAQSMMSGFQYRKVETTPEDHHD